MTVGELTVCVQGTVLAGAAAAEREVRGGYVSDLLSDVMANAQEGDVWVTLQRHVNIVAVAHLKGIAVVVLVNGRRAEADTVTRANDEGIPIVSTPLPAFEAVGALYAAGVRGRRET